MHAEYAKLNEDQILFGSALDMADIKKSQKLAMRIVPLTDREKRLLANVSFVRFLGAFGIGQPRQGERGFLQVQ